jgi:esterase
MKLFCRKYGNGPPLIILHGLFGSSDNWVSIAKNLSGFFTVYLPDLRNHGQSPHSEIHDYESMSADLLELANDLKIKKFFLSGHSMGGKTAILFALKWPEMLNGLLIADISPFVDEAGSNAVYSQHLIILNAILTLDLSSISTRAEAEKALEEKIPSEKERGLILKNLGRSSENSFIWKLNPQALMKNLDNIMTGVDRRTDYNRQITGFPVIFLKGSDSDYIPVRDYRDILKVFPAAEIIEVKGAGHWIHADRPAEVTRYLKKLLPDS